MTVPDVPGRDRGPSGGGPGPAHGTQPAETVGRAEPRWRAGGFHRDWVRLDNAANIFLAARTDSDPKVFRLSAELDAAVDRDALQRALDTTYDRYRLYHAVLRRGVFWYYLQDSELRPRVSHEDRPVCAPLYRPGRRSLLFRVVHHHRRVSLEVFHALSDGAGASWFFGDLLTAYAAELEGRRPAIRAADTEGDPGAHGRALSVDSFTEHFRRRRGIRRGAAGEASDFRDEATPAPLTVSAPLRPPGRPTDRRRPDGLVVGRRVHRPTGRRTPDRRTRVVELVVPVTEMLALARAHGGSMTTYLTALLFEAIRASAPDPSRVATVSASIPVNLRQFFASASSRNFFAAIRVEHTFGRGSDDMDSITRDLEAQFRPQITPEALAARLRRLVRFERMLALRVMPRPVKDTVLRVVNRLSNRGLSVAVSNLGRSRLDDTVDDRVGPLSFAVSAARPQLCAISHGRWLTLSFTSPYVETGHVRELARALVARGVPVRVGAARVTEQELREAAPEERTA